MWNCRNLGCDAKGAGQEKKIEALSTEAQHRASALREIDPFVLSKADPLCAQSFVEMGSEEKAGSFAGSV